MLKHLLPIVAATLLLLIIWASAVPLYHWFAVDDGADEFADRQAQWQGSGVESYEYIVQKNCFCGIPGNIPVQVVVRDSLTIAAYDSSTEHDPSGEKIEGLPTSIPALFNLVLSAQANNEGTVEVAYDETYGFPRRIKIDPSPRINDDEVDYRVENFRVRTAERGL